MKSADPRSKPDLAAVEAVLAASGWGPEPEWRRSSRGAALGWIRDHGFPAKADEGWRYTPLGRLSAAPLLDLARSASAAGLDLAPWRLGQWAGHLLVFVDGRFSAELSAVGRLPEGATLAPLSTLVGSGLSAGAVGARQPEERHAYQALNTALAEDGYVLRLDPGVVVAEPIHVVFLARSGSRYLRNVVIAGTGSRATLVESWCGDGSGPVLVDGVTEATLSEGAEISLVKVQREGLGTRHLGELWAEVAPRAKLSSLTANLGGGLVRNDTRIVTTGPEAGVDLAGVSASDRDQHVENHVLLDHALPGGRSTQVFKAVLDGDSTGVFRGKVLVRSGAQKTDSNQQAKSLLLSRTADMNSKPELEIYADDVKCAHGATVGALDPTHLFYLRSRGIGLAEARRLLIQAFAGDVLDRVPVPELREALKGLFSARFG